MRLREDDGWSESRRMAPNEMDGGRSMNVDAERAGFDPARLERITGHLDRNYIQPGKIAGCQVVVARHGQPASD